MPLKIASDLLQHETKEAIRELEKLRKSAVICIYADIESDLVDIIARQIENKRTEKILKKKLDIILHTSGGDPDAAFNIGRMLQRATKKVTIIVPRRAKSAGTILACSANNILMLDTAELGPLDAQIIHRDKNGNIIEKFSALAVKAAEEKIKKEIEDGNNDYAESLTKRMPHTILSTELQRTLTIAEEYSKTLLSERMMKGKKYNDIRESICKHLTAGYSHHGYVIDINEAKTRLQLNVDLPKDKEKQLIQEIHNLHMKQAEIFALYKRLIKDVK